MSDSFSELSPEELQELIRHGRITTSRAKNRRKEQKKVPAVAPRKETPRPVTNSKEPTSEWLKLQAERAEKNIAAPRDDAQKKAERQEASKF